VLGQAGYALVGLHAAAALWHHHVIRDNTLALMWPPARAR
jgi:cytochrome b561